MWYIKCVNGVEPNETKTYLVWDDLRIGPQIALILNDDGTFSNNKGQLLNKEDVE